MSNDSSNKQGTKRKGGQYYKPKTRNPTRGGPGILMTCETSREHKCRREGLDVLNHYWNRMNKSSSDSSEEGKDKQPKQSLEDEIAALKKEASKTAAESSCRPFQFFDTGVKGTVWFLFNPNYAEEGNENDDKDAEKDADSTKKPRTTRQSQLDQGSNSFDAIALVQRIFHDLSNNITRHDGAAIPGSRFVTRMIPMQATCAVDVADMERTCESLLRRCLAEHGQKEIKTFAINPKRRNCGHMKRDVMIQAIGGKVAEVTDWKVNLKDPDITIALEVCKSICGISLFTRETLQMSPNWNVAGVRDQQQDEDEGND